MQYHVKGRQNPVDNFPLVTRNADKGDKICGRIHLQRGVFIMKTAAEYRAMAEECLKWAREARSAGVRASYMQIAEVWLQAASQLDLTPPSRTRTASPEIPTKVA